MCFFPHLSNLPFLVPFLSLLLNPLSPSPLYLLPNSSNLSFPITFLSYYASKYILHFPSLPLLYTPCLPAHSVSLSSPSIFFALPTALSFFYLPLPLFNPIPISIPPLSPPLPPLPYYSTYLDIIDQNNSNIQLFHPRIRPYIKLLKTYSGKVQVIR